MGEAAAGELDEAPCAPRSSGRQFSSALSTGGRQDIGTHAHSPCSRLPRVPSSAYRSLRRHGCRCWAQAMPVSRGLSHHSAGVACFPRRPGRRSPAVTPIQGVTKTAETKASRGVECSGLTGRAKLLTYDAKRSAERRLCVAAKAAQVVGAEGSGLRVCQPAVPDAGWVLELAYDRRGLPQVWPKEPHRAP